MKFVLKSTVNPPLFAQYVADDPVDDWDSFRSTEQDIFDEVRTQLLRDQRGLCAYCEIDLIITDGVGYSDFRVEHFHPKHDTPPLWTFRWDNLLAVCCGGDRTYVCDNGQKRYTAPDLSCDAAKKNKILDEIIFNPSIDKLLLTPIFSFSTNGEMTVTTGCQEEDKATATIRELGLSTLGATKNNPAQRLNNLRAGTLAGLSENVQRLLEEGMETSDALQHLATVMFDPDPNKNWPTFFSCVRWYLGPAAEDRLNAINYGG